MCHRRTDPMILIETEALTDFRFSILIFGEQINDLPLILPFVSIDDIVAVSLEVIDISDRD